MLRLGFADFRPVLFVFLCGCYSSHTVSSDAGVGLDGARDASSRDAGTRLDAGPDPLVWGPCDPDLANDPGDDAGTECATVDVPLFWEDPSDSRRVTLDVARVGDTGAGRQLYVLQGGPGGASLPLLVNVSALSPGAQALVVEHRGVGMSSRLGCPTYEAAGSEEGTHIADAEWNGCVLEANALYGDSLRGYTSVAAARDLDFVIELLRRPSTPVTIYSVSYGTYWAQRYLEVSPNGADAIVLDSICSPGECRFPVGNAESFSAVGGRILDACTALPSCAAHVGGDATAKMRAAFDVLNAGRCGVAQRSGLSPTILQSINAAFSAEPTLRNAIPAIALRVSRCGIQDSSAIQNLAGLLGPGFAGDIERKQFSDVLFTEVARTELWDVPAPTPAQALAATSSYLFAQHFDDRRLLATELLTRGTVSPLNFVDTNTSLLMLNGTLDPQTELQDARPTMQHYAAANQYAVEVPRATHATAFSSQCGQQMTSAFLQDWTTRPDSSCSAEPELTFESPDLASALFGSSSLYDVAAPRRLRLDADARSFSSTPDAEIQRLRERARRAIRDVARVGTVPRE